MCNEWQQAQRDPGGLVDHTRVREASLFPSEVICWKDKGMKIYTVICQLFHSSHEIRIPSLKPTRIRWKVRDPVFFFFFSVAQMGG